MTTATPLLNSAMPRDLRGDGPAAAGAGKTYDVDPAAVEKLRAHIAAQKAAPAPGRVDPASEAPETAVPSVRRQKAEPVTAATDPAAIYPAEVIQAAQEQEQKDGRRNLAAVLTDDVLAIWDQWNKDGMSLNAIGQKTTNQLIELAGLEVGRYLRKYRERLEEEAMAFLPSPETAAPPPATEARRRTTPGSKAVVVKRAVIAEPEETAVAAAAVTEPAPVVETPTEPAAADPLPKPEIEPLETAPTVAGAAPFEPHRPENLPPWLDRQWAPPPAPRPGDALGALVQLLNDERITVKGSVKLNVEIEFGG